MSITYDCNFSICQPNFNIQKGKKYENKDHLLLILSEYLSRNVSDSPSITDVMKTKPVKRTMSKEVFFIAAF